MKTCPQCGRVETDETLRFCRVDGAVLNETTTDEFSDTRILTTPQTGEQRILTDTTQPASTTSTLDARAKPATQSPSVLASGVKRYKVAALLIVIVTAIGIISISAYLHARSNEVAIRSIAVLPFVNQNNDPNVEYLSDGIPESIINSLSQLPNLKVMSRNSVFHYKGKEVDAQAVARDLKVQAVLTGRLVMRSDGLAIGVELINAQDNSQLWGQQYNRKLADVFALQEEIAKDISDQLRLKLTSAQQKQLAKRPTENLKAFQYYMQGRNAAQRRTRRDLQTAIDYYEKALAEDGNYALAYAGIADANAQLGVYGYISPIEGRHKLEESARKALALDENLADAHIAVGQSYIQFAPYDFSQGDRELRRAIELSPSLALAHFYLAVSLSRQGRLDEALQEHLKARELDPLSAIIARNAAVPYYLKRDYQRAREILQQANELGPPFTSTWEIGVYLHDGSFSETLAELDKAQRERKGDPIVTYFIGMIYAAQGKREQALQIIKELEGMSGSNLSEAAWIAKIYVALNDKNQALGWLERGLATGALASFFKDDPLWDPIRSDSRFGELLRRMGFPQ